MLRIQPLGMNDQGKPILFIFMSFSIKLTLGRENFTHNCYKIIWKSKSC